MRLITVPEPILVIDHGTGKPYPKADSFGRPPVDERGNPRYEADDPWTFHKFLVRASRDKKCQGDHALVFAVGEAVSKFEKPKAGAVVAISDEGYNKLDPAVKDPDNKYDPTIYFQVRTFFDAWMKAETVTDEEWIRRQIEAKSNGTGKVEKTAAEPKTTEAVA